MSVQRVVVGVDGSALSFVALDAAALESQRRRADLEVVYCVLHLDEADPILRACASRVTQRHPGLAVITTAVVGHPADVLIERGRDAALTVVGSRGLGSLAKLIVRSVSHRVAARTAAPLLVVKGTDAQRTHQRPDGKSMLLALDNEDNADAALFAFEEAELRHTRLDILHAWACRQVPPEIADLYPTVPAPETITRRATAAAAPPGAVVAPPHPAYNPRLEIGARSVQPAPYRALIAATADAELVVIATHRRRNRPGAQLGTFTNTLLHQAQCPVAIVPVPEA